MKKMKIDLMTFFTIGLTLLMITLVLLFSSGCAQKTVTITKYKYIEKQCPRLNVYEPCDQNLTLTAVNKNNQICIKEWNGCIDKDEFIKLAHFIQNIKTICKKYETEIKLYNQKIATPEPSKQ